VKRPLDNIRVEAVGIGELAAPFASLAITNDIMSPSEAAFELGNDGAYSEIQKHIAHGTQYKVWVNDLLRLTGRVEALDIPIDAAGGSVVRFTVRTKLADAAFSSAPEGVKVKDTSIKKFILAVYKPLGYTEADFVFDQYVSRDLITGKRTGGKGSPVSVDLEPITVKDAKVQPPETIYDAADRHLRRHGLIHWDSPDGKIVVGGINDTQDAIYKLLCNRGANRNLNNVMSLTRVMDWSDIPSTLAVFGVGASRGTSRARVGYQTTDADVTAAGFYRPVKIIAEGLRTSALAKNAALREQSARSKDKDSWQIELDQWSWWDGSTNTPWGVDCVVEIESDIAGGNLGKYYVHRVMLSRTPSDGDVTNITALKAGVWRL